MSEGEFAAYMLGVCTTLALVLILLVSTTPTDNPCEDCIKKR